MAEELGRSESTVGRISQAARASLEEILKGRPPIIPSESHRDENLAVRVQDILEEELEPRPIRVQAGDLLLTEKLFLELLEKFSVQSRTIAIKYFVEGKRFAQIQAETVAKTRVIAGAIESASDRIGRYFGEPIQPSPRSIWIVDEQNLPIVPRRQMDFALPPKDPVHVEGAKFWAAIKDLPLKHQEIAKMRFIDGLSSAYIGFITGMNPGSVTHVLSNVSQRVSAETGQEVSVTSLVLTGDTSMIHVSAVEIPARAYLEILESRNNPSEATKLSVARMISGLPVENLPRVVLTDPIYEHLLYDDNQEHFMPLPQDAESFVSVGTLELVRRRLSDVDGRVLKLYLQHRWSVSTLSFYFKMDAEETRKSLERGGTALERELGTTLQLKRVLVVDSEADARTIQVDAAEFRDRFRRMPTTSLASVKVMLREWQGVELTPEKRVELLGPDGRRLFDSREEFRAPVPANPTYFLRADFENALLQSNLSDQEKQILRLRFFDGWGAAGITYLLELPPNVARRAIEKGVIHLNMRTREKIYAPNLRVVPRCSPDIHLRTHAVSAKQYEAIMTRVMVEKDYRPEAVAKIVEEVTEIPGIGVDNVTLINDLNQPPSPGAESFRRPEPSEPIYISHRQMWDAMNTDDQRQVALLRFEYGWSRHFIMRVTGKTENQLATCLDRIAGNLKRKVDPELNAGRAVVRD